jgi:hypothetical protein
MDRSSRAASIAMISITPCVSLRCNDPDVARDAFGVVCNCVGAWEDEYSEERGEDALTF